jgi:FAD/FMN-containing dehydrogenase
MSFDGGQTYCPFGSTCTITLGVATCVEGLVEQGGGNIGSLRSATMNLWPNPNDGTRVNVSLTGFDETINTVGVEVMDLHGRMVSTSTIPVQDGYMNTVLPIEQALAPGLYMVNLQVGDDRYTERLVIQ